MRRRKGIPLVALIIFIVMLVAIIITCAIILGVNKNKKKQDNTTAVIEQKNENNVENKIPEETEDEEEIEDEILMNNDKDIRNTYKLTGSNSTFAKYAIYESEGFDVDSNNISDDLKLQLAMSLVTSQDMDSNSGDKSVAKEVIEDYAKDIFGDISIKAKSFSLYNSDINFTEGYRTIGYTFDGDNDRYTIEEHSIDNDYPPEITEVVTKIIRTDSKMEIYVKPIFVKTFYSEQIEDYGCELYTDYDFEYKDFENGTAIVAFGYNDFQESIKTDYKQDIDGYNYEIASENIDLNSFKDYKYTFINDGEGYKLKSFEKVTERKQNQTSSDVNWQNIADSLSDQEVLIVNAKFESYLDDDELKGSMVRLLLSNIDETNSNYEGIVVSAEFDNREYATPSEISELKQIIKSSNNYTAEGVKNSKGFIEKIIIKEK